MNFEEKTRMPHFIKRLADIKEYCTAVFSFFQCSVDVVCESMTLLGSRVCFPESKLMFR